MMMLQLEGGNYKYNINSDEWVLENILMHNEAAPPPILLPPHDLNYNYNYTPIAPMQTTTTTTTSLNPSYFLHQKKKKENHNASERERRKKLNTLYSSLRSLLPHHMKKNKKQSIPTTVSQVLKYVPELKHQLHRLIQRKQHLLISTSPHHHHDVITQSRFTSADTASAAVCVTVTPILMMNNINTTRDDHEEVVVQISQLIINNNIMTVPLSELIRVLENEGFILINVSSVPASTHLFYTLHLQAGRRNTLQPVEHIQAFLRHKILSLRRLQ